MKKFIAGVVVAVAALAGPALAADIPVRAPAKAPAMVVPAAYNWSGFYTATTLGGGWQHINGVDAAGLTSNSEGTRWWMGSHIGYQWQWSNWVLGVEGGFIEPFGHRFDSSTGGTAGCTTAGAAFQCNSRINYIWTAGGRVGYAFGNWMVFGQGGWASGRFEETITSGGVVFSGSKESHSGWYAGGGVEWYVTRLWYSDLILGIEYRHFEFDSKSHVDIAGPAFNKTFNGDVDMVLGKATFKWVGMGPLTMFMSR